MASEHSLILDQGQTIKAGYGGEDQPRYFVPSVVGRSKFNSSFRKPKFKSNLISSSDDDEKSLMNKDYYVGDEALLRKNQLFIHKAIEKGNITDWNEMELIWEYLFEREFRIETKDSKIVITESIDNPKRNRERICQVMFERFEMGCVYLANQQLVTLYGNGETSGIVADLGEDHSTVVHCYEGYLGYVKNSKFDYGGRKVGEYLSQLITERRGVSGIDEETIRFIKENYASVKMENDKESIQFKYELPDGNIIHLGDELFECCEIFFNPQLIGAKEDNTIAEVINHAAFNSKQRMRDEFYSKIFLSGGSGLFKNLDVKLQSLISNLAPPQHQQAIKVSKTMNGLISSWVGCSILSTLETFNGMYISKEEYENEGPNIVHRKCW